MGYFDLFLLLKLSDCVQIALGLQNWFLRAGIINIV